MHRLTAAVLGMVCALAPVGVQAAPLGYGDPPGWCTNFSDMWQATVVTDDPLVATNPERDTFYGFHANPGYDDWYGFFDGDFRGVPGDSSGWVKLLHEGYPHHYHWNFGDFGWAVHGHVRQYIAYYNWTFGGQCGFGYRGAASPPPYMADQYGYPIVDIYVDAVAPYPPKPYIAAISPSSVTFSWAPVADRGDGAGRDFFVAGMDHYVSWVTMAGSPAAKLLGATPGPRTIAVTGLKTGDVACVHVQAVDRVGNATPAEVACGAPVSQPPMPAWQTSIEVAANPTSRGLVGLDSWFWLNPRPATLVARESIRGVDYVVTATPQEVGWTFGDGSTSSLVGPAAFGDPYPTPSSVTHAFGAYSETGYAIGASIIYQVTWTQDAGAGTFGPFPMGSFRIAATQLRYPVEQAQPELIEV